MESLWLRIKAFIQVNITISFNITIGGRCSQHIINQTSDTPHYDTLDNHRSGGREARDGYDD
jgi:hypothetical protein